MNVIQGWINLYKPTKISSFQAINKIKKKFMIKKIGHAGTLDPLAEGILPIALGKATKLIPYVNIRLKTYIFTISWGSQTSTDDSEGEIIFQSHIIPNFHEIKNSIKYFIGKIKQVPPKYSAVKINGHRAYALKRKEKDFEILPKIVFLNNLKIIKHENSKTTFIAECGKGFYIRSLARDLALHLNTYGHISSLERIKVGHFDKKSSILLDDLLKIGQRQMEINCVKSTISMLDDILAYEIVEQNDIKNLSFGRSIKINENLLKNSHSRNTDKNTIFLSHNGNVISIGKLVGNLFKPNKILI